jgi:hypothetical protein
MNVTKVSYKKGVTVNTGNFESERFDLMVEVEINENEEYQKVTTDLIKYVDKRIDSITGKDVISKGKKNSNDDILI